MNNKFLIVLIYFFSIITIASAVSIQSNIINSTTMNQKTSVPIEYRAIVGIILIIVSIFAIWKFFKIFIGFIFGFVLVLIIISTSYYFFTTGTFSLHNSFAFLGNIWNWFFQNNSIKTMTTNSPIESNTITNNSIQTQTSTKNVI